MIWLSNPFQVGGENAYQFCLQPPQSPAFIGNTVSSTAFYFPFAGNSNFQGFHGFHLQFVLKVRVAANVHSIFNIQIIVKNSQSNYFTVTS